MVFVVDETVVVVSVGATQASHKTLQSVLMSATAGQIAAGSVSQTSGSASPKHLAREVVVTVVFVVAVVVVTVVVDIVLVVLDATLGQVPHVARHAAATNVLRQSTAVKTAQLPASATPPHKAWAVGAAVSATTVVMVVVVMVVMVVAVMVVVVAAAVVVHCPHLFGHSFRNDSPRFSLLQKSGRAAHDSWSPVAHPGGKSEEHGTTDNPWMLPNSHIA